MHILPGNKTNQIMKSLAEFVRMAGNSDKDAECVSVELEYILGGSVM